MSSRELRVNSNCTVTSCKDDSQAACFWPQTCLLQNQGCPSNKLSRSIFYGGVQLMPTCDDLLSNLPWCDDTVEQQGLTIMLVVLTNAKFGDVVARKLCRTNDQIQVTTCFHPGCWSVAVQASNRCSRNELWACAISQTVRCELACAINADLESARLFRERFVPCLCYSLWVRQVKVSSPLRPGLECDRPESQQIGALFAECNAISLDVKHRNHVRR